MAGLQSPLEAGPSTPNRFVYWAKRLAYSPQVQAVSLCLLVGLPLALLIVLTQTPAWPEVFPAGDDSLTELCVWHALHDVQLTGICSHHCFRNPGPMYFYLLAPLYWLTDYSRASFPVSVGLINLASLLAVLLVIGRMAGRASILAAAVLLVFYVRFLGLGSLVSAWPADVQTLPVLLAVVLFAAVAAGHLGYLPVAILVASLPLQTNVAYIPSLTIAAVLSLLLVSMPRFRSWARIHDAVSGSRRWVVVASLVVLTLLWALPVVREVTQPASDIAQIVDFFARHGSNRTWQDSLLVLAEQLAAFPRFCLTGGRDPAGAGGQTWILVLAAVSQGVLLVLAYGLARRMQRGFDAAVSLLGIALLATFAVSIHRIVGPIVPHMVHWMSIVSVLALFAAIETCTAALATRLGGQSASRWRQAATVLPVANAEKTTVGDRRSRQLAPCAPTMRTWCPVPATILATLIRLTGLALIAVGCALNVRDALDEPARRVAVEFDENSAIPELLAASQKVLQRDRADSCLVRIVDDDTWPVAADLVASLTKAGFHPTVDARWVLMFGPQHAPPETPDGIFLLYRPESGRRWNQKAPWELVAETPQAVLAWHRAGAVPEGDYAASDVEFIASRLDGFSKPERDGNATFRWSNGIQSTLDLELEPGHAYRVVVTVRPFEVPQRQQAVSVLLNDHEITDIRLPHAAFEDHAFTLPADLVTRHNRLTFRYRYAQSPQACNGIDDDRELAVCFARITLRKAGQ